MKWLEMTWFGSSEELSSLQIDSLGIKPQVCPWRGLHGVKEVAKGRHDDMRRHATQGSHEKDLFQAQRAEVAHLK